FPTRRSSDLPGGLPGRSLRRRRWWWPTRSGPCGKASIPRSRRCSSASGRRRSRRSGRRISRKGSRPSWKSGRRGSGARTGPGTGRTAYEPPDRACGRGRRRDHGPRDRPGLGHGRRACIARGPDAGAGRARDRADRAEPGRRGRPREGLGRGEGGGAGEGRSRDVACGSREGRRPRDRGSAGADGSEAGGPGRGGAACPLPRVAGHEHLQPERDRAPIRRSRPGARARDAFLQPRAHQPARGGRPRQADLGSRGGGGCGVRRAAREGTDRGERLARVRVLPARRAPRAGGHAHGRTGRGESGGDRQGHGDRLPAPHGAVAPDGPGRSGRPAGHRALPVPDARLGSVPAAGDPGAHGAGGQARAEDGRGLLPVGGLSGAMTYETLLVNIDAPVATVVVNRPEKRNALNATVHREMVEALDALREDPEVRVVIITGTGDRAFIAGADIGEFLERTPLEQREFMQTPRAYDAIASYPKPTIAMINGFALGGGCEVALACDIRVAAQTAKLGQPEIRLGIIPGGGGTQRLPRLVGFGRAMRLILTGELSSAEEAERIGLVDAVVPDEELVPYTRKLAEAMAAHSPVALRVAKDAVRAALSMPLDEGLRYERELFITAFSSEDRVEGVRAFLEKRAPEFRGR